MPSPFPTIGVVGSGAVGTYYGARMALAGANVRFLMRGDLRAVRERGSIVVRDRTGTTELRPVSAHATPEEVGPVDLAVVCLKTTTAGARALVAPLVGAGTAILTLQNGFGADEALADVFGPERIIGGLVFMAISRTGPGEVVCFNPGMVSVGEFGRPPQARTLALAELLRSSGFKTSVVENLVEARWSKLVWNIPFNGLSIVEGGITTDRICGDPRLAGDARALMLEVQRAAAAFGFRIPDEFIEKQFEVTPPMGAYRPSSLVDFLAGREVEVEAIWGEPLRRARAAGVPMPRLEILYERLLETCPRTRAPLYP
jgi:2-dehydropantoate 2-reductase